MGVGGVKNCQNHPYVINEWPPTSGQDFPQDLPIAISVPSHNPPGDNL